MADATGSIAFLGAARFQGYWNAATNEATGSALEGAKFTSTDIGLMPGLFETGSSPGGGYGTGGPNVTASAGDYWQVTGSGTHNADGATSWNLNDWCIYSGSASGTGAWRKLAFEDTIASIVIGDLSSSSFHMGAPNDTHVIFGKGSVHSGSSDFVYNYEKTASATFVGTAALNGADGTNLILTNADGSTVTFHTDPTKNFGDTSSDGGDHTWIINTRDITGGSEVRKATQAFHIACLTAIAAGELDMTAVPATNTGTQTSFTLTQTTAGGAGNTAITLITGMTANGATAFTNGRTSAITNVGNIILTGSFHIADDKKIIFGADNDASIEYDEDGTDELRFAGANVTFEQGVVSSFISNPSSLNYDVTIPASTNAIMYGPITVAATKTITISDTAVLKIIDISEL